MKLLYSPGPDRVFIGNETDTVDPFVHEVNAEDLPAGTRIQVALGESEVLPSFDFETYSEAGFAIDPTTGKVRGTGPGGKGGLPVVGTPVYAEHPSTDILCLYYNLKDGKGRQAWYPGGPNPQPLIDYVLSGGLIEAWNITFEFWLWNIVGVRRYGWPPLPLSQCRCAMAKSRRHSLPGALGRAAKVLGTPLKDPAGNRLVQKLTRPHTPTKNRKAPRWTLQTAWDDYLALYSYCDQDTVAEDNASAHIPDLSPDELATWQLDQTINARGVQVDMATLDAAIDILEQTERSYNAELGQITGGLVLAASELPAMQAWLAATHSVCMPDMQKDTIADMLKGGNLPTQARRVLEIRATLGAANVKKLRTLKLQVSSDGRLRDQYMYCGADRTGRASAGGVQLQNITAKGPKTSRCGGCGKIYGTGTKAPGCPRCGQFVDLEAQPEWTIEAVEQAIEDIQRRDLDHIELMWGDPIALLCGCLRGLFIAKEGHKLVCCDFSAIEAVAAACLARCQWRIEIFSGHGKIYEQSAANATGIPLEEILEYKRVNGMHHPARKTIGKVRELACFSARTQVLTRRGYVSIVGVRLTDELWDGVEWVRHEGRVGKGKREVINLDGVQVTPEHRVNSGDSWTEARLLASNQNMLSRALEIGSGNLPLSVLSTGRKNGGRLSVVAAEVTRTFAPFLIFIKASRPGVVNAAAKKRPKRMLNATLNTRISSPTTSTADGSLTDFAPLPPGAIAKTANNMLTTVAGAFLCVTHGAGLTARRLFSHTLSLSRGGMYRNLRWTDGMWTGTMSRAICGLLQKGKIALTNAPSGRCKPESMTLSDVYDIVNAGPRNRFTIKTDSGHLIVHNCGYGGWVGAAKNFGADEFMTDDEIKADVLKWREESPEIVEMWGGQFKWCGPGKWDYRPELFGLEGAAINAILHPGQCFSHIDITYGVWDDILFCRLPSGRYLHYHRPRLSNAQDKLNRGPSYQITFEGYNSNSTKGPVGWHRMETYGGRLFENVVQAVAADIQFEALKRCEARGYPIVMHTHDEGSAEVPLGFGSVPEMAAIMSERPAWASWWPLKAAGWEHKRYQKD